MSAVPPGAGAARWQAAPRQPGHGADLAAAHALDAYLVWDLLSGFSRHRGGLPGADPLALRDAAGQPAWWAPVLLELAADAAMPTLAEQLATLSGLATEGRWLARRLAPSLAGWPDSRIHGAIVPAPTLPALHAAVAQGLLARFQLGAPCADPGEVDATSRAAPPATADDRHLLGVVDDGCCLAHAHFRGADGLRSRIAWLWDQDPGARPAAPWGRYRDRSPGAAQAAPYGAELARRDIDALLRRHPGLGPQAEAALYRALGRSAWGTDGRSHGARVLQLLAQPEATDAAGPRSPGRRRVGFVQLPHAALVDTSGHSVPMHVVAGARYLVARSRDAAPPDAAPTRAAGGAPVWSSTVCIALGGTAGPHDGSTLADKALGELAALPQVRIVAAAGNLPAPRRSDPRRWLHAERLVARGRPGRFWIRLAPCNPRHAFVELWLPGGPGTPALSQYQAVVTAPGGAASAALGAGEALTLSRDGRALAALVFAHRVAQGEHGTMLLLAVGPTGGLRADASACAPAGVWCVELRSQATAEARVHAWVERDDAIEPPRRPQQTFFERDPDDDPATPSVNDACTLSSLAHGARVVVAAGLVASDGCAVDGAARAQRRLPDGRLAPVALQLAPSERGYTLPGVAVPGFHSGMHATLNGSSAAVPQVARRLAAQADGSAAASAGSAATVRP